MFICSGCLAQSATHLFPQQFKCRLVKCILSLSDIKTFGHKLSCALLLESNRRNRRSPDKGCIIIQDNSCVKQTKWPSHAILEYVWCKVRNDYVQPEHKSEKNTRLSCRFKFSSLSLHLCGQTKSREYANSNIKVQGKIFTTEMHDLPHIYLIFSPWQLN